MVIGGNSKNAEKWTILVPGFPTCPGAGNQAQNHTLHSSDIQVLGRRFLIRMALFKFWRRCPTWVPHLCGAPAPKEDFRIFLLFSQSCRPAGLEGTFSSARSGENSVKHFLNCGNRWRAAHLLSTIRNARGLLLGDCEAIPRKDTWAAPVKLPKWRRGETRMMPGEAPGEKIGKCEN